MGLAVPSVAEASRGLPSVKTVAPPADDEIVTSVSFAASAPREQAIAAPEQVSPELALVDPELAERVRARLPEPEDALASRPAPAPARPPEADPEPRVEATTPREIEPEPIADVPAPVAAPVPAPSNVRPLRPVPVVEASDAAIEPPARTDDVTAPVRPRPEIEIEPQRDSRIVVAEPEPVVVHPVLAGAGSRDAAPSAVHPPVVSRGPSGPDVRRTLVTFAAGAVAATFVVVGVIAALGESDAKQQAGGDVSAPSLAPPAAAPVPKSTAPSRPTGTAKKPAASASKKAPASAKTPTAATKKAPAAVNTSSAGKTAKKSGAAARAVAPARRFAWAPVDGAVGYRVELFRGDEQVLRTTTKQPVYELPTSWRHQGRAERLTPGSYRWYVWPLLSSGPAAQAVVQANLDVS